MWLLCTAIAALWLGYELAAVIWRVDDARPLRGAERALFAALLGLAIHLGSAWLLALLQLLERPALIARTLVLLAIALVLRVRTGGVDPGRELDPRKLLVGAAAAAPIACWCAFVLWRSLLVPPLSHDALSYHLPKAAMYVQAGGYRTLHDVAFALGPRPSSYEVLLADAIVLDGDDTYTEWLSVFFFLAFIAAGAAMAQRWWAADRIATITVALLLASTPVLLLHTGAHKNDVMAAFFMTAMMVAGGRYIATHDRRALLLAGVALAAAAGTKTHAPLLGVCLAPFILLAIRRDRAAWNWRRALALLPAAALAIALLGGSYYLERLTRPPAVAEPQSADAGPGYGDWQNLLTAPWVLLTAPFAPGSTRIWVPGAGTWRLPRYELYFSHLGAAFAVAALAMPFCMLRFRNRGSGEVARERIAITIAALAAFTIVLPVRYLPEGLYVTYLPRFVLFLVPVVLCWSVPPLMALLRERSARAAYAAPVFAALLFSAYAIANGANDLFVPMKYVWWARAHPGTRVIPFDPNRPVSIADRAAGPNDVMAVDAGSSIWIYPAYGPRLSRRVELLPRSTDGMLHVPDDARWVVVDRSWNVIWGDRRFRKLADYRKYLARGVPSAADMRVLDQMRNDPRFATVYVDPRTVQGVFVRR